ncbi:nuclear transport factor 2 family protein [Planococcus shenhongbingii]|uniref:Nuclear transport factor 2 family protein n=1 Tax=Planococcus shenhongbingii TaxID=3058398 RepID=A0ABT8NGD7_9BACL|nr:MULTISPECIES: nuclear transport factor 2 family protein [unclassified Planococcus (in: firmicutes)]MDN7246961.1 nuclear transport factor 2 family protein [Planococcus sp. N017]WKA56864.1 nuclear transport factor 2 family protein [Planococcus sp. N016]
MSVVTNQQFFEKVNRAFIEGDINFLADHVAEDVVWMMYGNKSVGREEFINCVKEMGMGNDTTVVLTIENLIASGNAVALKGKMHTNTEAGDEKIYTYCDIYELENEGSGKIKELTSFILDVKG